MQSCLYLLMPDSWQNALVIAAGLAPEEQARVEFWLGIIGGLVFVLIVGLLGLAVAVRYIAKHSTQPCRWCMEFISKKATVCPRCGKSLLTADERPAAGSVKETEPSQPQTRAS
jgi:hypothetical protein